MENTLLRDDIRKLFFRYIIPSIIGVLVNSLYVIVDGVFIGNGVGAVGLASVNIDYPAICFNIGIGLLLGIGAATVISIKLGEDKKEEAKKVLGTSIFLMIIIGIVITIVGLIFLEPLMRFFGAEGDVLKLTKEYTTIMFLFTTFHILSSGLNPIVRADGNPKLSMGVLVAGALINIFLDWLFVMKLNMGIRGAATATVIGISLSASYLLYYFFSDRANIKINFSYLRINHNTLKSIMTSGVVSFLTQTSLGIMYLIQDKLLLKYGTIIDVSIFAIVAYISVIFIQILLGIAQGIQPIVGYNYGAGEFDRTKQTLKLTIIVNLVLGILGFILVCIFNKQLVLVFNNNPQVVKIASKRLIIYLSSLPVLGIVVIISSYYQATKNDIFANILSIARWYAFLIPLSYILSKFLRAEGIFWAQPISDYLSLILVAILYIVEKRLKINN